MDCIVSYIEVLNESCNHIYIYIHWVVNVIWCYELLVKDADRNLFAITS